MGANPLRRRSAATQEPVQRSDGGEARLWHLGTALAVSFTVAVVGLGGLAWLAWILMGLAGYRHHGIPALKDTVSVLQLVFATVAGAGALVALIVAYRRQKITEADSVSNRTRVLNERFTAIAAQLGDDQPAIRLAGVHAMAGLADDWKQNRQTCVDVLCAYLRLPYEPDPGDDAPGPERLAYRASREVRHTVIRIITAHLKPDAAVSWQGLKFDFTDAVFDGGDFSGAEFSGGSVDFSGALFSGGSVDFSGARFSGGAGGSVDFSGALFSGGLVDFSGARFSSGVVYFSRARFSGGTVTFDGAVFSGAAVYFDALFSGGRVSFTLAGFSSGLVYFAGARFSGGTVSFTSAGFSGLVRFDSARFAGSEVSFDNAGFSSGRVDFMDAEFSGGTVTFADARFFGGTVTFDGAVFSGGTVTFADAEHWSHPPVFSWDGKPPTGVVLPAQPSEGTEGNV